MLYHIKRIIANFISGWFLYAMCETLGWKKDEALVFLAHVRKQLNQPGLNLYCIRRVVYGRKPETC